MHEVDPPRPLPPCWLYESRGELPPPQPENMPDVRPSSFSPSTHHSSPSFTPPLKSTRNVNRPPNCAHSVATNERYTSQLERCRYEASRRRDAGWQFRPTVRPLAPIWFHSVPISRFVHKQLGRKDMGASPAPSKAGRSGSESPAPQVAPPGSYSLAVSTLVLPR